MRRFKEEKNEDKSNEKKSEDSGKNSESESSESESEDATKKNNKNSNKKDNKNETKVESKSKPVTKTLFGDPFQKNTFSTGLFGDLSKSGSGSGENKTSLFSGSLFGGPTNTPSIFAQSSQGQQSTSLFSSKPLFNFSSISSGAGTNFFSKATETKENESDSEGGEGDNDLFQSSNSPNPYNPTDIKSNTNVHKEQSVYKKKYVKNVENVFVYSKDEGKFVSKGNGFLSLEQADENGKKVAVVVFR
jgi:hypothetical protein